MNLPINLKRSLRDKALELGFEDAGFTGVEPLDPYLQEMASRPPEMYGWSNIDLARGARIGEKHPWARSVIVLLRNYHKRSFPAELTGRIGRCYQVDERIEKKEEHRRLKAYFEFLEAAGIQARFDMAIPARMAAARAGLVTYGKNCFAYARRALRGASWIEIIPIAAAAAVEPDEPSIAYGCPEWCRNACLAACPTRSLYRPGKMNPLRCIAYQTYYAKGITPAEFREPMGTWIYGCDRCQQVCPRNEPYLNQTLPVNASLEARAGDFRLEKLLTMSDEHYIEKVWPLCFYIPKSDRAKWQMNAARAIGNLGDRGHIPILAAELAGNPDERVRGMCAWALGRLGGTRAQSILQGRLSQETGLVREEIESALRSR